MRSDLFISTVLAGVFAFVAACSNSDSDQKAEVQQIEIKKTETVAEEGEAKTVATIGIEGMTCQMGCANVIKSKLSGLKSVVECDVAFEDKKATVQYDDSRLSEKEMIAAIRELGDGKYSVTKVNIKKTMIEEKKSSEVDNVDEGAETKKKAAEKNTSATNSISFPNIFDAFTRLYQAL